MWRDERLHTNVSDLDATLALSTLRNLKPKRSVVNGEVTHGFIPQDVEAHSKELVDTSRGLLELPTPIHSQTMTFLVKLNTPCPYLYEGRRVVFKDSGEFKIKEVIDNKNFTIHLEDRVLPKEVQLTHIEVTNLKSFDKDIVTTLTVSTLQRIDKEVQDLKETSATVSTLQELDKEVQDLKESILNESRLKTLDVRMSLLENLLASISKRLDSLENL
jgi:vacuolar-type H+-ATPase subunit I/STV1